MQLATMAVQAKAMDGVNQIAYVGHLPGLLRNGDAGVFSLIYGMEMTFHL